MTYSDIRTGHTYEGRDGKRRRVTAIRNGLQVVSAATCDVSDIEWTPVAGWSPRSKGGYIFADLFLRWAVGDVTEETP